MNGGMDRHQFGVLLVATVVLGNELTSGQTDGQQKKRGVGVAQAFSYSHVIHDHSHSVPHLVKESAQNHHHHQPLRGHTHKNSVVQTVTKQVPYPVLQPYPVTVERHIPYAVSVPVPVAVDRPYPVPILKPYPVPIHRPVPVTVERPYPVALKYPVRVPVPIKIPVEEPQPYPVYIKGSQHDKGYSDEEDDYSGSNEADDRDR